MSNIFPLIRRQSSNNILLVRRHLYLLHSGTCCLLQPKSDCFNSHLNRGNRAKTEMIKLTNEQLIYFGHKIRTYNHISKTSNNNVNQMRRTSTLAERIVNKSGPLRPYLKLIRLDKPIGCWFLFWPFGWSISLASPAGCLPDFYCLFMFASMAFIMRGAGCTMNDMWDKNIDSQVSRTKDRPLANNEITQLDALVFLGMQLGTGLLILLECNFYTVLLCASSIVMAISYPLMKKLIPWPQVFLGFSMNWGTLIGFPAVSGYSNWAVSLPLYLGGICWTVVYDTMYAFQDEKEDRKLGLKSTAISFSSCPKMWLTGFSLGMISSLVTCGLIIDQTWPYYFSLSVITSLLSHQIYTLDVKNKEDCAEKFAANQKIGLILFLGIVFGNLLKLNHQTSDNISSSDAVVDRKEVNRAGFVVSDKAVIEQL